MGRLNFQTLLVEGLTDTIFLEEIQKSIISLEGNLTKSTKIKIVKALSVLRIHPLPQIYLYMYTQTYIRIFTETFIIAKDWK